MPNRLDSAEMSPSELQRELDARLRVLSQGSLYAADANEPDPRYRGYGVRMPAMRALLKDYRKTFKALPRDRALELARALIDSGYGEQKTIALELLLPMDDYFTPERLDELEALFRKLYGWSKIDGFAGKLLQKVLMRHPRPVVERASGWSQDPDLWLRRASVVLYTRKVAESGRFHDAALANCERLKFDEEDMVRKGVGWCLKDLMRGDRERVIDYVSGLRRQGVSSVVTLYAIRDLKGDDRRRVLDA
ncbi:MAG: DNA alkylation repair protein [Planctomycetota bacterium]